jgi:hypothetical protein
MAEVDPLAMAREEFLAMVADAGGFKMEIDGDETGDHTTFSITVGWSQLRDFCDAIGLPPAKPLLYVAESDVLKDRIEAAVAA